MAILGEYGFSFPIKINKKTKLKDFLEEADEKYFLTTKEYILKSNGNREYHKKSNRNIKYDININRFLYADVCGIDVTSKFNQTSRINSENGTAPTLTASNTADNCKIATIGNGKLDNLRIRTITPKEAWRLMGFSDEAYNKAKNCTSERNLYHQAGNSIVVDVLYYILKNLFVNSTKISKIPCSKE